MCTSTSSATQRTPEGAETVTLTIDQLEDLLESLTPSASEVVAGLANAKEAGPIGLLWEKCGPCIAGFKACVKCSWTGCKVRIRRC